jgi:hypothetical protein
MTLPLSRRNLLAVASLSAGSGLFKVSDPGLLVAPVADTALVLTPVADRPLPVRSPDSAALTTCPQQLAVQIVNAGATVPAGAQVEFAYDARLYAPADPVSVTAGTRRVDATSSTETDPKTGLTTCRIAVHEEIPARAALVVLAGTAHPLRYPYDLVRRPGDTAATLARHPRGPRTRRDLRRARTAAGPARTPWGIELTGGWARQTWGDEGRFVYYRPVSVRLRGTGPGIAPRPASFTVTVDPRLVAAVTAGAARLNGKPAGPVRRTGAVRDAVVDETRWTTTARLGADDVLDIVLHTETRTPAGALETIKHPVVVLTVPGDDAQRLTGQETLFRSDAVWQ